MFYMFVIMKGDPTHVSGKPYVITSLFVFCCLLWPFFFFFLQEPPDDAVAPTLCLPSRLPAVCCPTNLLLIINVCSQTCIFIFKSLPSLDKQENLNIRLLLLYLSSVSVWPSHDSFFTSNFLSLLATKWFNLQIEMPSLQEAENNLYALLGRKQQHPLNLDCLLIGHGPPSSHKFRAIQLWDSDWLLSWINICFPCLQANNRVSFLTGNFQGLISNVFPWYHNLVHLAKDSCHHHCCSAGEANYDRGVHTQVVGPMIKLACTYSAPGVAWLLQGATAQSYNLLEATE